MTASGKLSNSAIKKVLPGVYVDVPSVQFLRLVLVRSFLEGSHGYFFIFHLIFNSKYDIIYI